MSIFDVVVNTDDLVVLGPPNNIDVSLSFGESGPRGATFFAGSGNPNSATVSENIFGSTLSPAQGDLFINTSTGSEYGWLYIYNPKVVGDQWDQVLRIQPTIYASSHNVTFSSGVGQISVATADILPPLTSQENVDNYIVTFSPIYTDPVCISITDKSIVSGNLVIDFSAAVFNSTWSTLNDSLDLQIKISVI